MPESEAEEKTFEQALERLEQIVAQLEEGRIGLDEALERFEEGVGLSRFCNAKLEEIERKIEILTRDSNGRLKAEPFEEGQE